MRRRFPRRGYVTGGPRQHAGLLDYIDDVTLRLDGEEVTDSRIGQNTARHQIAEDDVGDAEFLAKPSMLREAVDTNNPWGRSRMADEIKYEYKTVRTVRGTDGLMISKMQKDGWELIEQDQGAFRSTLGFRRPKKPQPWLLIGATAAVLVILAIVIGVATALSNGDEKKDVSGKSTTAAGEKTSAAPAPTATKSAATEVITPQNNPEFAALLKADRCDDANLDFANRHKGQTIAFNGSIVNMAPHGDYDTRYDFLLGPGDKGPQTTVGPAFKYEDVNTLDLNLTGKKIPATVGEGDKFRFVAEVGGFNAVQCLFFLDPISTEVR